MEVELKDCEIKNIMLNILLDFDTFCKKNNLKYFIAYGTLIGAIRHKGFIPWDDDIDVCMPRNDYEKFLEMRSIFEECNHDLKVISNEFDSYDAPFTKIENINTITKEKNMNNTITGIWIDIFPLDGLPNNINEQEKIFKQCDFYRRLWYWAGVKWFVGSNFIKRLLKILLKPLAMFYGRKRCTKNLVEMAKKYKYKNSEYICNIAWGFHTNKEIFRRKELDNTIYVEFEKHFFPTFACYDSWLRNVYGDYMVLPPIDKRENHNFKAYFIAK